MGVMDQIAQGLSTVGNSMMVNNNPTWAKIAQDQQQTDILRAEYEEKMRQRQALRQLAQQMEGQGAVPTDGSMGPQRPVAPLDRETALKRYAGETGDFDPIFKPAASGGGTGFLVAQLMAENPSLSYADALFMVQSGFRKGVEVAPGGAVAPREGLGGALGQLGREEEYGKETGKLEAQGELKPTVEADVTKAQEDAKKASDSEAALPKLQQQVGESVALIDDLLADEGLDSAVGGILGMQGRQSATLPLSENQRRVQPKIDQIKGKAFLQAFQDLKGAGAITENEGTAATKAMARLEQSQDEKSFRAALTELKTTLATGLDRHKRGVKVNEDGTETKATAAPAGGAQRKTISFGALK